MKLPEKAKKGAKLPPFFLSLSAVAFWVILWQLASMAVGLEVLLPAPLAVLKRLGSLMGTADFYIAIGISLSHVALGFFIGFVCGILTGTAAHLLRPFGAVLSPLLTVVKATPVASFILLAYVWMTPDVIPIFTSFLMVFPMVHSAVFQGLSALDRQNAEMLALFSVPFLRRLKIFYLPSLLPFLKAGAVTAMGTSWKAGIAAEVLCSSRGSVGKYIYESKYYLETVDLFAWTVTVILLSLMLENLFRYLLGKSGKEGAA